MISNGLDTIRHQHVRQLLCGLSIQGINNTALSFALDYEFRNAFQRVILLDLWKDLVIQVVPVERGNKYLWISEVKILHDIALHFWSCSCGQSYDRCMRIDRFHHIA